MMRLKDFITKHEGKRLKPYKCTAEARTIGVGFNFDANHMPSDIAEYLKQHGRITDEMCDRLLDISLGQAAFDCRKLFPEFNSFSDNRKMALIDFLFNLGFTRASRFVQSVHCINTGQWDAAAAAMRKSSWAKQVGKRAVEVTKMIEEG